MIKIEKNSIGEYPNVYIFSDPHYSHKNICRGVTNWRLPDGSIPIEQTRPFDSIEKMNATIVNNINDIVGQDDILICLGDWSFSGIEKVKEFRDRLICRDNIHLVLGNHDDHIRNNRDGLRGLFKSVTEYNQLEIGEHKFELMHYPLSSWRDIKRGTMMLHGHVHLSPEKRFGVGKKMDCGLDGNPNFSPYHVIREIVPLLKSKPICSDIIGDHHTDTIKGAN